MLIDVVLYNGERDLLEARLDILQADQTIVIEGDRTFTGNPRKVKPLPSYVRHVVVKSGLDPNPWENEYQLRHNGYKFLNQLGLKDTAIIGFFDVDEIPDPELIRATPELIAWKMKKYQMSLAWYQHEELTGLSGSWANCKDKDVAKLRWSRHTLPSVSAGYHLSSFMTLKETLDKWQNFSHQELIRPQMDQWVENCWTNGLAIENGVGLVEQSLTNFPERLLDLPEEFTRVRPK